MALEASISNLTTISDLISKFGTRLAEAEFKFEPLQQAHSNFCFCSEDTTGVIRKIEYDSSTNSFIGFSTPITDGIPSVRHFQANAFEDLKMLYDKNEMARLLNVHMFQRIPTEDNPKIFPKPCLLSAYGTDNRFTSIDILRRWIYIFQSFLNQGVRIIGFSTDADNKYMSVMRLGNPPHLITKWRNRLLSSTANLCYGNDKISIKHIENLIDNTNYTKLVHGLIMSDINPKDRQNYHSCIKLISDDVLNLLKSDANANGTFAYLALLKMIMKAYVDRSTNVLERIQSAWLCESIFRDARSLSGTFSTKINFTVKYFLRRSQQLSILNQLKYGQLNKSISFPVHHKHKQEYSSTSSNQLDDMDTLDIEHIILAAYDQAIDVVKHSKMYYQLNQHNINNLSDLSKYIFDTLNNNSRMINYSSPASHNTADEFGLDEENDDNDDMYST
ncbi:unnamed protein product [Rotaria socialis]|uniref:Uncharacterized protein n=1 Tax=Rotaria socialis TaxID=392032 RepID=A0A820Y5K4_9BILA|nr:unnamed protein product [Rotaria socialis]